MLRRLATAAGLLILLGAGCIETPAEPFVPPRPPVREIEPIPLPNPPPPRPIPEPIRMPAPEPGPEPYPYPVPEPQTEYRAAPVAEPEPAAAPSQYCCKVCTAGKACGDSCISRSYTCHKGPGCACDAY